MADGLHARADGFTSLAVLVGAVGVALGWDRADAVAGLLIGVAIFAVLGQAAMGAGARLMDAVSPELVDQAHDVAAEIDGVEDVGRAADPLDRPPPPRGGPHHRRA